MASDYQGSTARGATHRQNLYMEKLLRSPDHARVSDRILLITFTGRTTGNRYSTPLSYMESDGTVICFTDSRWWRNLEGGVGVQIVLRGQDLPARAVPVNDPAQVEAGLRRLALKDPDDVKYFGVSVDADGQPNEAQLRRAAEHNVMLLISIG